MDLEDTYQFDSLSGVWRRSNVTSLDYSDGDEVETRIGNIIRSARDRTSESIELQSSITDWPSRYHLDARRSNVLKPIRHLLVGNILEVGAGTGAITRYLGECGGSVVAVEGSVRRAAIAAERCRELKNVRVVADDFSSFRATEAFDVIVIVGVLEYARKFFRVASGDPVEGFIKHVASLVGPGGIVVVAIENQIGLKYLAGANEDHIGAPMVGVEDRYEKGGAVTFGRLELEEKLRAGGLISQQWWFPFPDYKVPISIVSDRAKAYGVDFSSLVAEASRVDPQITKPLAFSLERAWRPLLRNGLLDDLSNSFLVIASKSELVEHNVLALHYGMPRNSKYNKEVRFEFSDGETKVSRCLLRGSSKTVQGAELALVLDDEIFVSGLNWQVKLSDLMGTDGWSIIDWVEWAGVWFTALLDRCDLSVGAAVKPDAKIPGMLADAIPRNLILTNTGDAVFFDQEWHISSNLKLSFMVYRALSISLFQIKECARPIEGEMPTRFELLEAFYKARGWPLTNDMLEEYKLLEDRIQEEVAGVSTLPLTELYKPIAVQIGFADLAVKSDISDVSQYETLAHKHHMLHFSLNNKVAKAVQIEQELSNLVRELKELL